MLSPVVVFCRFPQPPSPPPRRRRASRSWPGVLPARRPPPRGSRRSRPSATSASGSAAPSPTSRTGQLWKIEGNPDDPLSRGRLCPRGTGGIGAHFDDDRLKAPLIRSRQRGEDVWAQVTWDEALSHIAEKMQAIKAKLRPRGRRALLARPRRHVPQAHAQGLRLAQHRRAVVRAVPRPARRRVPPDVRRGDRVARAHRHPQRALPGAHRLAPRREHAQHAGAGVRRGHGRRRQPHRRRSALLDRGRQGEALPADQAGHGPRAACSRGCTCS